jgi:hypothetical protein
MSNPSNLYSEKVFAEHPIVLWSLDDKADYISLISEPNRNISLWEKDQCSVNSVADNFSAPFQDSFVSRITGVVPNANSTKTLTIKSPELFNFNQINTELGTFSIGLYLKPETAYLKTAEVGYEYYDSDLDETFEFLKQFNYDVFQDWTFLSATFESPMISAQAKIFFRLTYYGPFSDETLTSSDYQFLVNGISVGQWSENYQTTSLGIIPEALPTTIDLDTPLQNLAPDGIKCVGASAYGSSFNSGYYLILQKSLTAQNTSIPMVYGAKNVTKIFPNYTVIEQPDILDGSSASSIRWTTIDDGGFFNYTYWDENIEGNSVQESLVSSFPTTTFPSLIIPGKGMLNQNGKYKTYTFEMWIRLSAENLEPKRIFGPIKSNDGIYVERGFVSIVLGSYIKSHYVGEWFRPMLMQFTISKNLATLIINGEEVISMNIDIDSISLPQKINPTNQKDQDWLGFYAYDDIHPIEIDAIAIYPYKVPINVAKKRFVYGQGVSIPESLTSAYNGVIASIEYPNAGYTNNYCYPNHASWNQATSDNLNVSSVFLETPSYSLPQIYVGNNNYDEWLILNSGIQSDKNLFYTFNTGKAATAASYIKFDSLSIIGNSVGSIYGVFMSERSYSSPQVLFKFINIVSNNSILIRIQNDVLEYVYIANNKEEVLYSINNFYSPNMFTVGINIESMINYFGDKVSTFFGNIGAVSLYVGGMGSLENNQTFLGKIYSVGIDTKFNSIKTLDLFNEFGVAKMVESENFLNHISSYTLIALKKYNNYMLDIAVASYWEDYIPLSYFAKNIKLLNGSSYYDLDFLQFNIDYPEPAAVVDNNLNTSTSSIKTHIAFQYIKNGVSRVSINYQKELDIPINKDRLVDVSSYSDWDSRRFEVVNGTVIYPNPASIDFNDLAISYSLDFSVRGILTNPIKIRKLEFASKSLNETSFNPIGTEFGVDLYPYKKSGVYFDYKTKNPYAIYKESTPYLYLTKDSGIELRGEFNPLESRGIAMPINPSELPDYTMSAIQMWIRYDREDFPTDEIKIFEVEHAGQSGLTPDVIDFFMKPEALAGGRARIYARTRSTGLPTNGISYYWNGVAVVEPRINTKEWGVLGISFAKSLKYNNYSGSINICGPITFNLLSHYRTTKLQELQKNIIRPWLEVLTDKESILEWQYWESSSLWNDVLILSSSDGYKILPDEVYKTYMGTNKTIIDDTDAITILFDTVSVFSNVIWTDSVYKAL